ncbi:hypothetical protein RO3G_01224 [Rhizopus delemar RA 99-880]|uniref:Uncharacterized protein n=1 Tax=Rhizopus delemar (strain RA 99-880 / ATCC MYA-4621 / FGSC 9543 / NRRL 43880) TaxID=246409 RepID=I1BJY7_RHIO9|nr:hypothetical protein RO3G_01221 [Rhizopus delemar RA 99-880]EIE76520.1 hypothetical protein RO3G_01224 [Rhizopus delemar RA 99-880]|eukprot:EIE76517.1 hypothetical protein RO3G_01221 [Rhizopus delemar RA 99-880]
MSKNAVSTFDSVRNLARWSSNQDESETTVYRRFAALLDILLDSSNIKLIDGESTSEATKASIDLNRSIFGLGEQSHSFGRRIDLMLGIKHKKQRVEISSNEFKKTIASKDVVLKQQCKNLRTNACIIQQIIAKYKINTSVMVMDFVGSFGCLYMIKKTEEQFYIAKPVAKLAIPYNIDQLGGLEQTLSALFQMRPPKLACRFCFNNR